MSIFKASKLSSLEGLLIFGNLYIQNLVQFLATYNVISKLKNLLTTFLLLWSFLWKHSYVVPVHKSGSTSRLESYRPISLSLSSVSKEFENVVFLKVYSSFTNIFSPEEHGFFQQLSTATNLFLYVDFITTSLIRGSEVDSVYTDFNKAFD